ncbi:MAG: AAA family ATPase [Paludibacteraceae bacterium]|nr:AAA family ATPase [Paludibacteraceae bacterium]
MLEQFIKNRIIHKLPFEANEGQRILLDKLSQFITSSDPRKAFILRGYAGTGKTTIMAALVEALQQLQQRIVLLAPTGRAAKVLSRHSHTPAYTIHKYIYRQKRLGEDIFTLNDNLHHDTLFIVDEASMISGLRDNPMFGSGILLDDLVRYVYNDKGCYLLMLGDDAQLPPIGSNKSPALDETYMSGYQLSIFSHTLTEVARQAIDSGILENATRLRPLALGDSTEEICNGLVDNIWKIIEFRKDICTVSGTELLEAIEQSYSEVGVEETILLTRTNKRTNIYNQGIRARILWKEEEIGNGDRVMVCKNNYFWTEKYDNLPFLANGDMLEIVRLRNIREIYGYHFADAQLRSLDYDWEIDVVLWLETIHSDNPDTIQKMHKDLFYKIAEDYPELQHRRKELTETIYKSPYYNALQIRMAYAITGHKSQGGQWARVFIDPYKGGEEKTSKENIIAYYRWLYTTITRATEKVYFIKNT